MFWMSMERRQSSNFILITVSSLFAISCVSGQGKRLIRNSSRLGGKQMRHFTAYHWSPWTSSNNFDLFCDEIFTPLLNNRQLEKVTNVEWFSPSQELILKQMLRERVLSFIKLKLKRILTLKGYKTTDCCKISYKTVNSNKRDIFMMGTLFLLPKDWGTNHEEFLVAVSWWLMMSWLMQIFC